MQLILHLFRLGKGVGRHCRRESLDRFAQCSLGFDQELQKRHQVRFLAPSLSIACEPTVAVILDPLPYELDVAAGARVVRLQFQAVPKGRNRRLQLVENLLTLFGGHVFQTWNWSARRIRLPLRSSLPRRP